MLGCVTTHREPCPSAADPLGEALHFLELRGAFYCRAEFTAPFGLELPPVEGYLWFHVITGGSCWLEAPQALPRRLAASELALIPHGEGHWLRSEPDAPTPSIFELEREQLGERYEILRHGGGGEGIDMVCGAVRFDHPVARKLLAVLPRILTLDPATSPMQLEWLRSTLRLMALEAEGLRPGGETMITRLSDVLVVQALRAWLESDPAAQSGWLGALRDPRDRPRDLAHPPRARPPVDPRLARRQDPDVTVGVRRTVHPACRRAGDELPDPLAYAPGRRGAARRRRNRSRTRGSFRLSLRGRVRARLQARDWNTTRCRTEGGTGRVDRRLTLARRLSRRRATYREDFYGQGDAHFCCDVNCPAEPSAWQSDRPINLALSLPDRPAGNGLSVTQLSCVPARLAA
jgi:hypothetical protein